MKDISGFSGVYAVTKHGEVWSYKRSIWLKHGDNGHGYRMVRLWTDGIGKTYKVHQLVARTFLPNPTQLRCINHKNGNKADNNVVNLEWCSHSHNAYHALKTGLWLHAQGESSANAKLNMKQVKIIRQLYQNGISPEVIGIRFGVTRGTVFKVATRRSWAHVS